MMTCSYPFSFSSWSQFVGFWLSTFWELTIGFHTKHNCLVQFWPTQCTNTLYFANPMWFALWSLYMGQQHQINNLGLINQTAAGCLNLITYAVIIQWKAFAYLSNPSGEHLLYGQCIFDLFCLFIFTFWFVIWCTIIKRSYTNCVWTVERNYSWKRSWHHSLLMA